MIPNCKKINTSNLDKYYPIGSYYETSDTDFDPNVSWGGTWIQDTEGLSTIGANTSEDPSMEKLNNRVSISVGEIRGELKHLLTTNEMAKHYHKHRVVLQTWSQINGKDATSNLPRGVTNDGINLGWSSFVEGGNRANDYEGGDQPHNNVQPSIGVIRWHRIG